MHVHPGQVVRPRRLVDERQVEGDLPLQVVDVVLLVLDHGRQVERLLVVVRGGGQQPQLVHGPAQVVVRLLAAAAKQQVLVQKGASLEEKWNN